MIFPLPELCLVLLIGPSGSGKSTLARRIFRPTEVISSDHCRALICDDESNQRVTPEAFELLEHMVELRLRAGRLTVVDATNVQPEARRGLLELARRRHVTVAAIVLDLPAPLCVERDAARADRTVGAAVIASQLQHLRRSLPELEGEGLRPVAVLRSPAEVEAFTLRRERLLVDRRDLSGPFDIIGDVHGCAAELDALLAALGYPPRGPHPEGRRPVFLGDLVDRGPGIPAVLRRVMGLVAEADGLCVCGNHEAKLGKALAHKTVSRTHGLAASLEQLDREPPAFRQAVRDFIEGLPTHYVLDGGRLVVAHAGLKRAMHGRIAPRVRDFALYGDHRGEIDEYGLPVRHNWAAEYTGDALVVYGHTPVPEPAIENNAICVDTGCVFGGRLTALRYPERELRSVPAVQAWYEPSRPIRPLVDPADRSDILRTDGLWGRHDLLTAAGPILRVEAEEAAVALQQLDRIPLDPRWLIALPPLPAPPQAAESPRAAIARLGGPLRAQVAPDGARAIALLCVDEAVAAARFGLPEGRGVLLSGAGAPLPGLSRLAAALEPHWGQIPGGWLAIELLVTPAPAVDPLAEAQAAALDRALRQARGLPDAPFAAPAALPPGLHLRRILAWEGALLLDAPLPAWAPFAPPSFTLAGPHDPQIEALLAAHEAAGEALFLAPPGGPVTRLRGPKALRRWWGPAAPPDPTLDPSPAQAIARDQELLLREGLRRFVAGEPLRRVLPYPLAILSREALPLDPAFRGP